MVKTPVGVSWPGLPEEIVEGAIGTPLGNNTGRCVHKLTTSKAGPSGLSSGAQTYSPFLSALAASITGRLPRSTAWAEAIPETNSAAADATSASDRGFMAATMVHAI